MADTTQNTQQTEFEKAKASFTPISVTRNGVGLSLTLQIEEKGPTAVKDNYLFPDAKKDADGKELPLFTNEELTKLIGEEMVNRILTLRFKKGAKAVYSNNLDDNNGILNRETFPTEFANYSFKAVSMAAIIVELEKHSAIMMEMLGKATTPHEYEAVKHYRNINIVPLQKAKAAKERSKPEDEEEVTAPVSN